MISKITNYINNIDYKITISLDKIHIYNYKSIIDITDSEALIKIDNKVIKIIGTDIKLLKLDKKELLISGCFKGLEL